MLTENQTAVRTFISYSWSSPTHESWVLNLASRLREDGVDVVLDKWDLKPGHDAYAFMESMVSDPDVKKVVMVCDRAYVEKSDKRSGGVGTESQIISPEIYRDTSQDKFAAIMTETDTEGNAYTPVFYKGRIYFDFISADSFEDSYEQLLRWIIDRPRYVKPKLGNVPESILNTRPTATATQSRARRAEEAIRQNSASAPGYIREYSDSFIGEIKTLGPQEDKDQPFDEAVLSSVNAIRPYIRQLIEIVVTSARFSTDARIWDQVLAIHENLGRLMFRSPDITRWNTQQFDPYRILAHEAFVSMIGITLDEERFDLTEAALGRPYLVQDNEGLSRVSTSNFTVFYQYAESLEHRNQRLKLNRISLQADVLKEAHPRGNTPEFESLMQADLFLYLRSWNSDHYRNWYPLSLVYAERFNPFPVFARSESKAYFDRIKNALKVDSVERLKAIISEINNSSRSSQLFDYRGIPITYLTNEQHLGVVD